MGNKKEISDELLAAFLEGSTSAKETEQVLQAMKTDKSLREIFDIAIHVDEAESSSSVEEILPMQRLAAESGENLCSVLCEAQVLRRRNVHFELDKLVSIAREHHWLRNGGVPLHSIGLLLSHSGLIVTRKYDAFLDDIIEALSKDNDVIVAVDGEKLYPNIPDIEDVANHAVLVTAVDQKADMVTIYDPQYKKQMTVVTYQFELAWRESKYYMVRVLQSLEEYVPHPIYLDYIPLDDDLLDLREAIAENAHDVWADARIKEGWTFGEERDDANKKHPDLIPYSALPESEKEYDRLMAFNTIKLVRKLGFKIVKI